MLIKSILIHFIWLSRRERIRIWGPITRILCAWCMCSQACSAAGGKCEWVRALNYYIITIYYFYILLRLVAVMYESTNHGLSIIILTLYITVMINTLSDPSNDTSISKGPVVITRPRGCELSGQNTLSSVYHIVL